MDNQIVEKCPECGNYTQGVPVYTTERKMVQKATKGGTSKIVGAVIGGVIGLPFFGIGAVPGAFIGFIIGLITGSIVGIAFVALLSANKDSEHENKN